MEKTVKTDKSKLFIIASVILLFLCAWLLWERTQLVSENHKLQSELGDVSSEKNSVKNELAELLVEYDGMKTNNKDLNARLSAEQEKIQQLLNDVQKLKSSNAVQLARYKKEIKTLRSVMRSFVRQIDSLNIENKKLTAEVRNTKSKYQNVIAERKVLEGKTDSLSTQVEMASTLKAEGITVEALNKRENKTTRARKTTKLKLCFAIRDNPVAATGDKQVYMRIAAPSGKVLATINYDVFVVNGEELGYSAVRKIFYNGKKTDACVFYDVKDELESGNYTFTLFVEGKDIGTTLLKLR